MYITESDDKLVGRDTIAAKWRTDQAIDGIRRCFCTISLQPVNYCCMRPIGTIQLIAKKKYRSSTLVLSFKTVLQVNAIQSVSPEYRKI